jgi:antitoxin component YwqK of YwqJK toxin-antitoxin module
MQCSYIKTYHNNNNKTINEEYFENNGKKEGIYKSYFENGQLCIEANYIDGKENGIFKSYFRNGQLFIEVNFIDGKKEG